MKQTRLAVLLFVLCGQSAVGQGISTGGNSLLLPVSADEAPLAGSNVAASSGLGAIPANPAALEGIKTNDVRFTHISWFEDVQSQSITAVVPTSLLSLAFAITSTSVPGIEIRDIPGPAIGTFTARAVTMRAGAALPLTSDLAVGLTAKYLYEKIYVDDATGFAADAGLLYRPTDIPWRFGISLTNVGSLGAFRTQSVDLPTALHLGTSRSFRTDVWAWTIHAAVSRETHLRQNHVHAGVEAEYDGILSVRAGYVSGYETRNWSAGVGLSYEFLRLDYALIPFELGLRSAHCVSIGVTF